MFDPNLSLFKSNGSQYPATDKDFVLVDGPSGGRTLRTSDNGNFRLIIGHQASNENPGFPTQRSVVRLESVKTDSESGKEVKLVAQVQFSVPKGHFTETELDEALRSIVNLMTVPGETPGMSECPDLSTGLARLYAGEP